MYLLFAKVRYLPAAYQITGSGTILEIEVERIPSKAVHKSLDYLEVCFGVVQGVPKGSYSSTYSRMIYVYSYLFDS